MQYLPCMICLGAFDVPGNSACMTLRVSGAERNGMLLHAM